MLWVMTRTSGEFVLMDCAPESPAGRRSVCYDREGWFSRKEARPENHGDGHGDGDGHRAVDGGGIPTHCKSWASSTLKTSSWIATPADIRERGGALWGGRSYGRVFIGSNGAQSYYAVRGFRGSLRV